MSEQRFRVCCDDDLGDMWVIDIDTDEEYWTAPSLVDLLNELAEENNNLKVLLKNADRQAEIGRSYVQQYCSPQQDIRYTKRIDNVRNQITEELGNDYLTLACKYL